MIGTRIQKMRQRKRLSLTEMAIRAGVAKSYLSSIERNLQYNPSIDFLNKIAPVLGVDIHTLLRDDWDEQADDSFDKECIELVREIRSAGISIEMLRGYLNQAWLQHQLKGN